jgi:hypothetical protein
MAAPNSLTTWDTGLAAWTIQDGNYPDFKIGQTIRSGVLASGEEAPPELLVEQYLPRIFVAPS